MGLFNFDENGDLIVGQPDQAASTNATANAEGASISSLIDGIAGQAPQKDSLLDAASSFDKASPEQIRQILTTRQALENAPQDPGVVDHAKLNWKIANDNHMISKWLSDATTAGDTESMKKLNDIRNEYRKMLAENPLEAGNFLEKAVGQAAQSGPMSLRMWAWDAGISGALFAGEKIAENKMKGALGAEVASVAINTAKKGVLKSEALKIALDMAGKALAKRVATGTAAAGASLLVPVAGEVAAPVIEAFNIAWGIYDFFKILRTSLVGGAAVNAMSAYMANKDDAYGELVGSALDQGAKPEEIKNTPALQLATTLYSLIEGVAPLNPAAGPLALAEKNMVKGLVGRTLFGTIKKAGAQYGINVAKEASEEVMQGAVLREYVNNLIGELGNEKYNHLPLAEVIRQSLGDAVEAMPGIMLMVAPQSAVNTTMAVGKTKAIQQQEKASGLDASQIDQIWKDSNGNVDPFIQRLMEASSRNASDARAKEEQGMKDFAAAKEKATKDINITGYETEDDAKKILATIDERYHGDGTTALEKLHGTLGVSEEKIIEKKTATLDEFAAKKLDELKTQFPTVYANAEAGDKTAKKSLRRAISDAITEQFGEKKGSTMVSAVLARAVPIESKSDMASIEAAAKEKNAAAQSKKATTPSGAKPSTASNRVAPAPNAPSHAGADTSNAAPVAEKRPVTYVDIPGHDKIAVVDENGALTPESSFVKYGEDNSDNSLSEVKVLGNKEDGSVLIQGRSKKGVVYTTSVSKEYAQHHLVPLSVASKMTAAIENKVSKSDNRPQTISDEDAKNLWDSTAKELGIKTPYARRAMKFALKNFYNQANGEFKLSTYKAGAGNSVDQNEQDRRRQEALDEGADEGVVGQNLDQEEVTVNSLMDDAIRATDEYANAVKSKSPDAEALKEKARRAVSKHNIRLSENKDQEWHKNHSATSIYAIMKMRGNVQENAAPTQAPKEQEPLIKKPVDGSKKTVEDLLARRDAILKEMEALSSRPDDVADKSSWDNSAMLDKLVDEQKTIEEMLREQGVNVEASRRMSESETNAKIDQINKLIESKKADAAAGKKVYGKSVSALEKELASLQKELRLRQQAKSDASAVVDKDIEDAQKRLTENRQIAINAAKGLESAKSEEDRKFLQDTLDEAIENVKAEEEYIAEKTAKNGGTDVTQQAQVQAEGSVDKKQSAGVSTGMSKAQINSTVDDVAKKIGASVIRRTDGSTTLLKNGDRIEVVTSETAPFRGQIKSEVGEDGRTSWTLTFNPRTGNITTIAHELLGHMSWASLSSPQRAMIARALGFALDKNGRIIDPEAAEENFARIVGQNYATNGETKTGFMGRTWDRFFRAVGALMNLQFGKAWEQVTSGKTDAQYQDLLNRVGRGEIVDNEGLAKIRRIYGEQAPGVKNQRVGNYEIQNWTDTLENYRQIRGKRYINPEDFRVLRDKWNSARGGDVVAARWLKSNSLAKEIVAPVRTEAKHQLADGIEHTGDIEYPASTNVDGVRKYNIKNAKIEITGTPYSIVLNHGLDITHSSLRSLNASPLINGVNPEWYGEDSTSVKRAIKNIVEIDGTGRNIKPISFSDDKIDLEIGVLADRISDSFYHAFGNDTKIKYAILGIVKDSYNKLFRNVSESLRIEKFPWEIPPNFRGLPAGTLEAMYTYGSSPVDISQGFLNRSEAVSWLSDCSKAGKIIGPTKWIRKWEGIVDFLLESPQETRTMYDWGNRHLVGKKVSDSEPIEANKDVWGDDNIMYAFDLIGDARPSDLSDGIRTPIKRLALNVLDRLTRAKIEANAKMFNEFPDPKWKTIDGIVRLVNRKELIDEGNKMGHCVGGYGDECESGRSFIYSVNGTSTLQLTSNGEIGQHYGRFNTPPSKVDAETVDRFIKTAEPHLNPYSESKQQSEPYKLTYPERRQMENILSMAGLGKEEISYRLNGNTTRSDSSKEQLNIPRWVKDQYKTEVNSSDSPNIGMVMRDGSISLGNGPYHAKVFGDRPSELAENRFYVNPELGNETVAWWAIPTDEQKFAVEDSLARRGINVKSHVNMENRKDLGPDPRSVFKNQSAPIESKEIADEISSLKDSQPGLLGRMFRKTRVMMNLPSLAKMIGDNAHRIVQDNLTKAGLGYADTLNSVHGIIKDRYENLVKAVKPREKVIEDLGGLSDKMEMRRAHQYSLIRTLLNSKGRAAVIKAGAKVMLQDGSFAATVRVRGGGKKISDQEFARLDSQLKAYAESKIASDPLMREYNSLMDDVFDKHLYKKIADVYRRITGKELKFEPHYIRMSRITAGKSTGIGHTLFATLVEDMSMTERRTGGKAPLKITDAFMSYEKSADDAARYVGYAEALKKLREVFDGRVNDGETALAEIIDQKHGSGTHRSIIEAIYDLEGDVNRQDFPALRMLMRSQDIARLSSPSTFLKQIPAFILPAMKYGFAAVARGMTSPVSKSIRDKIIGSYEGAMLKRRLEQHIAYDEIYNVSRSAVAGVRKDSFLMFGVRRMDEWSVNRYIDIAHAIVATGNKSEDQIVKETAKMATEMMNDYQPTGMREYRTAMHNSNFLGQILNRYRTSVNAMANTIYRQIVDAKRTGGNAAVGAVLSKQIIPVIAAQAIMFSAADILIKNTQEALKTEDKEARRRRLLREKYRRTKNITVIDDLFAGAAQNAISQIPMENVFDQAIRQWVMGIQGDYRSSISYEDLVNRSSIPGIDTILANSAKEASANARRALAREAFAKGTIDKRTMDNRIKAANKTTLDALLNGVSEIFGLPVGWLNRYLGLSTYMQEVGKEISKEIMK